MFFLVAYDRPKGRLVTFKKFKDTKRLKVESVRPELELDLNGSGIDHEVVILEAASQEALRRTHGRYFKTLRQILESAMTGDK